MACHLTKPIGVKLARPDLFAIKTIVSPYSTVEKHKKSALHHISFLAIDSGEWLIRQAHPQAIQ